MSAAGTWDPGQYLRFGGHRLRPALELFQRVAHDNVRLAVDMGCGTGDIARAMARRWPEAEVRGHDLSDAMLETAAAVDAEARVVWSAADFRDWRPDWPVDVLYANAVYHWADDHETLFPRLLSALAPGGVFAAQMPMSWSEPSHSGLRDVLDEHGFGTPELRRRLARKWVAEADWYYGLFRPLVSELDIWETRYIQVLHGTDPVLEWVKGTGLRPVLEALEGPEKDRFLALYAARLRALYPPRERGETLYPFPRLFIVARR
ncbi:MAG: methyltransferase domain-containing protein [Alphaproteobacteria bacterium]|nr:methyltransferase domain-containing protein [Alphaproteobacteria bacterium]MCY4317783.1 methyltransferase domain-containing protein [Alphaproteobacteria bacterium]